MKYLRAYFLTGVFFTLAYYGLVQGVAWAKTTASFWLIAMTLLQTLSSSILLRCISKGLVNRETINKLKESKTALSSPNYLLFVLIGGCALAAMGAPWWAGIYVINGLMVVLLQETVQDLK